MFRILAGNRITYEDQAGRLFNGTREQGSAGVQRVIPFLGAGVSVSGCRHAPPPSPQIPDPLDLGSVFRALQLDGQAKVFLELAIMLAYQIQAVERQDAAAGRAPNPNLLAELQQDVYPPSAGQLAHLFSQLSTYTTFTRVVAKLREKFSQEVFTGTEQQQVEALKLLARVTGIANPPDLLTSITSYYESVADRQALWDNLSSVISHKRQTTTTHRLLAAAAKYHLSARRRPDYLIVTTNYDCLMEEALAAYDVPYVTLLTRRSDQKVVVRFSEQIPDAEYLNELNRGDADGNAANNFVLQKTGDPPNLVVIYKIHGCLNPSLERERDDGVIISDNDYVGYIKQMGKGSVIPASVNTLMNNKPFLFLGYSLNDWNIRSIFESMREKRSGGRSVQDFSVMREVGDYEEVFFQRNDVLIFQTDLNSFAAGIVNFLPPEVTPEVRADILRDV